MILSTQHQQTKSGLIWIFKSCGKIAEILETSWKSMNFLSVKCIFVSVNDYNCGLNRKTPPPWAPIIHKSGSKIRYQWLAPQSRGNPLVIRSLLETLTGPPGWVCCKINNYRHKSNLWKNKKAKKLKTFDKNKALMFPENAFKTKLHWNNSI